MLAKDARARPAMAREVASVLSGLCERSLAAAKAAGDQKTGVELLPILSAATVDDTTRPDGVASRTRTIEQSSAGRIAWTRDSDAQSPNESAHFETTAAAVRALSGSVGGLLIDGDGLVVGPRTEMLDATPAPPTRTRAPITPSETPSSRKRSGSFQEPIPDFRGRGRWVPLLALGGILALITLLVTLSSEPESAVAPAPKSPAALATTHSAARPAPLAIAATAPAAADAPTPKNSALLATARPKAAKPDGDRRPPPADPAAASPLAASASTPAAPRAERWSAKRATVTEQALPGSGL
jgi:hypothetical protein